MNSNTRWDMSSCNARLGRSVRTALGVAVVLVGLAAAPTRGEAQVQSGLARVTLIAHAAPAVHLGAAGLSGQPLDGAAPSDDMSIAVNTGYRVELRRAGSPAVTLLRDDRPGLVSWTQIRAQLPGSQAGPLLLDLIVTPAL